MATSTPRPRNQRSTIIATAALLLTVVSRVVEAQQLLVYGANALPACAQQCSLLQQAQAVCVPPAAPATNQAAYESCFCQSAYLRTLYTTPNGVCDAFCTAQSDLVQIQQWYIRSCNAGTVTTVITTTSATAAASDTAAAQPS
ncbi:hypothetical protein LTR66_003660, partial [Elasticomyces elasticus]